MNRLLNGPGLSVWASSIKNRVNGNEAHLLDEFELSRFGPERLFSQPHVLPHPSQTTEYVGAISTPWNSIQISSRYGATSKYLNNGILDDRYASYSNWDSAY